MRYSRAGYWGATAAGIGMLVVGCAAVQLLAPPGLTWLKAGLLSAVAIVSMVVGLLSYRSADEVILARHKAAWFWGTIIALGACVPVIALVSRGLVQVPLFLPNYQNEPNSFFIEGIVFFLGLQIIAVLLVMAYQQLKGGAP